MRCYSVVLALTLVSSAQAQSFSRDWRPEDRTVIGDLDIGLRLSNLVQGPIDPLVVIFIQHENLLEMRARMAKKLQASTLPSNARAMASRQEKR